jgi:hypothetical protein
MMKTPFVAHPPSILVVHADVAMGTACKAAGASMGIPVRRVVTVEAASGVVHDTHPYVLAYDEGFAGDAVALLTRLAREVSADLVPLRAGEPQVELTSRLRAACESAEARRASA